MRLLAIAMLSSAATLFAQAPVTPVITQPVTIVQPVQIIAPGSPAAPVFVPVAVQAAPAQPVESSATSDSTQPPIATVLDGGAAASVAAPAKSNDLKFELRGRIQADALFATQSEENKENFGNILNTTGFRRARIGAQGEFGRQGRWVAEWDFAGGQIRFRDMYAGLVDLPYIRRVKAGYFREPFGFEAQYSSNYFPLMERSVLDNLNPRRKWGAGFFSYDSNEQATFSAGVFWSDSNIVGNAAGDFGHLALTARATALVFDYSTDKSPNLMHIGAAYSGRQVYDVLTINQSGVTNLLQFTDGATVNFVPTLNIPATVQHLYGLEWAGSFGSLAVQAEGLGTLIAQPHAPTIFYYGGYVMASLFLTGEHHDYHRKDGAFAGVKVHRPFICLDDSVSSMGPGAWEVVARLEYINYSNANGPRNADGELIGVAATAATAGLNWYLHDNARVMLNYTYAVPTGEAVGTSSLSILGMRVAVFW